MSPRPVNRWRWTFHHAQATFRVIIEIVIHYSFVILCFVVDNHTDSEITVFTWSRDSSDDSNSDEYIRSSDDNDMTLAL